MLVPVGGNLGQVPIEFSYRAGRLLLSRLIHWLDDSFQLLADRLGNRKLAVRTHLVE